MVREAQEMDLTLRRVRRAERQGCTLRNSSFQTQRELATEVGREQGSVGLKKAKQERKDPQKATTVNRGQ